MSPNPESPKSRKLPHALKCTNIELSTTLHMRSLISPVVEREEASAHTLCVADYPSMYLGEVSGRRTDMEIYHSQYNMLE